MVKSELKYISNNGEIKKLIEKEWKRSGGIFRLAPSWVARPGIIIPGRRLKLGKEYISNTLAINERWFASVTYADNGDYNAVCPTDHGLSYLVIDGSLIMLREAIDSMPDLLLGNKEWNVLPKFFDNKNRIPHHLHPCDDHIREGLVGKPESYHFPLELNTVKNDFPYTAVGIDPSIPDEEVLESLSSFFTGDNRLTSLSLHYPLIAGTGWFMPPCTLHAPGSLLTYELQVASDVSCIPESRVDDLVMPSDMIDRDLPYKIEKDGIGKVAEYILSMVQCPNSGNRLDFRKEFFRPPVRVKDNREGSQDYVIYRCGKASDKENPDMYSSKHTIVTSKCIFNISENAAFAAITLGGHGSIQVKDKEPLSIESVSFFPGPDFIGGDEFFVSAEAAKNLRIECSSEEKLSFYQHFASGSNPEAKTLDPASCEPTS